MKQNFKWNVYWYDMNHKRVEVYNVFDHYSFQIACIKAYKEYPEDKEKFLAEVKSAFMYYFWGKSEWETELTDLHPLPDADRKKLDPYKQTEINWDVFAEYIWNHKAEFKSMRRRR